MNTMWLDEPPMYGFNYAENPSQESIPDITHWRRTEFADFERLDQLVRMKTYDTFGDVNPAEVSENSCLSLVQINAINEVVTNISLYNYPNIPSVPVNGWLEWISRHYGIQGVTERNTLFVHVLLWDVRYNEEFYERLLDAVFISSIQTNHLIFIMPPWVAPVGFVEEHMTRIVPTGQTDSYKIQALYISLRHMHCPRLKIRRVVEEDNDDIIPILDRESERFKELYGQFYISEMMRYPDGLRQMVVAEADGLATGILCLNKIVDIEALNEHFELAPYHGLKKHRYPDKISTQKSAQVPSDILFPATELRSNDRFKVKPTSKTSAFYFNQNIDEDFWEGDRNELECLCSVDGEVCSEVYSDAARPWCENRSKNSEPRNRSSGGRIGDENSSKIIIPRDIDKSRSVSNLDIDIGYENRASHDSGVNGAADTEKSNFTDMADEAASISEKNGSGSTIAAKRISIMAGIDDRDNSSASEEFDSVDVTVEISPRKLINKVIRLPVYRGETNAFTLEIFSMRRDVDERLSHDYLEAVFECFPEQDYCVVLIPPVFPTFTLLQNFVRVPLRFNKDYPFVMYLAHRATVVGELKTREGIPSDVVAVDELLIDAPKRAQVLKDFEFSFEKRSPYRSYVFLCEGTLVGFAILSVENEIEFIRSHYRIDDFVCFDQAPIDSHARIIHLTIMPIFASLHRFFFQELMHFSDTHAVYYRLYHNDASALTRTEPLVTFLGEMIPVLPRKKLKYCLENYAENKPADFVLRNTESNFALYMMVPRVAGTQKIDVNVRVVVVGASDCGLALLETLVFGPKADSVSFANITLVSPNGIPFENRPDDLEKEELPFGGRYSRDYRHLIGTRAWINVVHGTLTAIHRKDKFVTVSGMGNISYDYLVLTCGLQYQRPKFTEELRAEKRGELRDYRNPENCLTINTERDAANCLDLCKRVLAENPSCSVIFYGQNIDCYSALAMLIKSGLYPGNITLVEPVAKMCEPRNTSFIGNYEIEEAVIKAAKESGVHFISDWDLVDWIVEENNSDFFVRALILEQKGGRRELACDVFFNFREKTINLNTFLAICESGLVFDGSLVIDPEFQTNDPSIFAAGTITKYSRRFYADDASHKYQNPCEVGERLGNKLRNIIDPKNAEEEISPPPISRLDMTLPVFKKPLITSCRLPGGYHYLDIRKPGKSVTDDTNDVVLITGYPASAIGYFRIHLNQFDAVETITCLSRKEFEIENYICLYGKHQTLLNDIKIRFQKSTIPDLYAYFREPWAVALFLDRFECLRVENRATLLSPTVVCGDTLIDDCTRALVKSKWDARMLKSVSPRLSSRGGEPRIIRLTTDQEAVLQEQFNRCPRAPHTADIVLLAAETGLSEADVQGWYAVRLAQWRKEQGLGGNLHFSN